MCYDIAAGGHVTTVSFHAHTSGLLCKKRGVARLSAYTTKNRSHVGAEYQTSYCTLGKGNPMGIRKLAGCTNTAVLFSTLFCLQRYGVAISAFPIVSSLMLLCLLMLQSELFHLSYHAVFSVALSAMLQSD